MHSILKNQTPRSIPKGHSTHLKTYIAWFLALAKIFPAQWWENSYLLFHQLTPSIFFSHFYLLYILRHTSDLHTVDRRWNRRNMVLWYVGRSAQLHLWLMISCPIFCSAQLFPSCNLWGTHCWQDEEGMCHYVVMPTLLLILTDIMNFQPDSAIFILNSVMDWDFDCFSD